MRPALLITALLFATPAPASTQATADFVHKASTTSLFEIESSQLALQKSQDPAVRAFAQKMVDDVTKSQAALQTAVNAAAGAPQPDIMLDAARQADVDALTNATPGGFDHLYAELQVHAHEDAVHLYGDYARSGDDAALRAYAGDALPAVQDHLAQIETIAGQKP